MSTGLIIVIVVAALLLLALIAFVLPRMRAQAAARSRQRELETRRGEVAGAHRAEADARVGDAERADREARAQRAEAEVAERRAEAARAEAKLHEERAGMTEQGLRDDEILPGDRGADDRDGGRERDRDRGADDRDLGDRDREAPRGGAREYVEERREVVEERPSARADGDRERLFDRESRERDTRITGDR